MTKTRYYGVSINQVIKNQHWEKPNTPNIVGNNFLKCNIRSFALHCKRNTEKLH